MGRRNYLVEGVSGTGKTSVCHELRRRGYAALNGDRDLRQHTDPATGGRLILRLHATREDLPDGGILIDATQPLASVVDKILSHVRAGD